MKRAAAALSLVLALGAPASPALAKKKKPKKVFFGPVTTVTAQGNPATGTGLSTEPSTATATCPTGTKAVGGGFLMTLTPNLKMAPEQSFRSSARTWTVVGNALEGTTSATAYAYCRKTNAKITDVTATATTAAVPLGQAAVTPVCPQGTRMIAGGFRATRGPAFGDIVTTQTSTPAGNAWHLEAVSNSAVPQTVTAHVYCAAKAKSRFLSSTTTSALAEDTSRTELTPPCPTIKPKKGKKGKKKKRRKPLRMSAGGFQAPPGDFEGAVVLIGESRLVDGRWQMTGFNNNEDASVTLSSAGVCL